MDLALRTDELLLLALNAHVRVLLGADTAQISQQPLGLLHHALHHGAVVAALTHSGSHLVKIDLLHEGGLLHTIH